MIQSDSAPAYGSAVSVNAGANGILSGTFFGTDATGRYGYVAFSSGPYTGLTLSFPFGNS